MESLAAMPIASFVLPRPGNNVRAGSLFQYEPRSEDTQNYLRSTSMIYQEFEISQD